MQLHCFDWQVRLQHPEGGPPAGLPAAHVAGAAQPQQRAQVLASLPAACAVRSRASFCVSCTLLQPGALLRCRVHDVVHFDLLDHMHKRGKAADEHSAEPQSEDKPFSPAMLAKVHTIVPLIWRCGPGPP